MSRHLYDIEKMMDTVFERKALADLGLYESVIEHRKKYSRHSWLDYSTLDRHSICFLPPSHVNQEYKKDYEVMKEEMIFGNALEYDELLNRLQELLERFRNE